MRLRFFNTKNVNILRLLFAGFTLIWLYLKSPLNPLYCDYTSAGMMFVYYTFIYWFFVAAFFIWLIMFIDKGNYEKYSPVIYTGVYGIFFTFFIFYGLDVLDSGLALSKQWSMFNGLWKESFDIVAGTSLIGGSWLAIYGEPFLLWSRLGYSIVQVITAYFTFKIMILYFKPREVLPVAIPISLSLSVWSLYFTINYDNLPYMFFVVSVYLLLKSIQLEKNNKKLMIFSGIFLILAAFCRITYFPAFVLHIFVIYTNDQQQKNQKRLYLFSYFLYGCALCSGFLMSFMYISGVSDNYLTHFINIFYELLGSKEPSKIHAHNHSGFFLLSIYRIVLISVAENIYKYFVLITAFSIMHFKTKDSLSLKFLTSSAGVAFLYYFLFEKNLRNLYTDNNFIYQSAFFIALYMLLVFCPDKDELKKHMTLIYSAAGLFFFSFLGSDLGLRPAFHTGSGLILFSIPVIILMKSGICFLGICYRPFFIFFFVIIAFTTGAFYKKDNIYRETEFSHLIEAFSTPSLAGIKSNPLKVAVVDSLLAYLNNIPDLEDKKLIFTHSNPLMYYLTGTNYPLKNPWDVLNNVYELKNDLFRIMPGMIIVPETSHRVLEWPVKKETESGAWAFEKYYEIFMDFINENNYSVVYENSFYKVYSKKGFNNEAY